jgi:hypothetical protein
LTHETAGAARSQGTSWLVAGAVLGGVAAYLFQVVGTRTLGEDAYAPIGTLWTVQYLMWSVFLYALETYMNREVVLGRVGRRLGIGPLLGATGWVVLLAVAVTGLTWTVRGSLFYGIEDLALVAGLIVLGYGAFAVSRGRLAGGGRYRAYGFVSAFESVVRVMLAVGVLSVAATTRALAWIMPVGAAAAAGLWPLLGHRAALEPRRLPPAQPPRAGRFLALTSLANAAVQTLLAGAPLVMVALAAAPADVSVVFVTMTAARVPIVLALGGLLSRMLPAFVQSLDGPGEAAGTRLASLIIAGTLGAGAAGAVGGAIAGPTMVRLLFGAGFTPPWWFAAATGGGVLLATGGMLLNQLLTARGQEHWMPAPWLLGVAAATAAVVLTEGEPMLRVTLGFVTGELTALIALALVCLLRPRAVSSP